MSFGKHRRNTKRSDSRSLPFVEPLLIRIRQRAKLTRRSEHSARLPIVWIYRDGLAKGFDRALLVRQVITEEEFFAPLIVALRHRIIRTTQQTQIPGRFDKRQSWIGRHCSART